MRTTTSHSVLTRVPKAEVTPTLPVLGGTCAATIDLTGTTGHDLALLVGYSTSLAVTLGSDQVLLVNVADSNG